MKELEEFEVEIIDMDHMGLGIAKKDGFPIFINNAVPGDKILIRIDRVTKNLAMATNLKLIQESDKRQEVICEYYDRCGGCNIMHLSYEEQLAYKEKITRRTIQKVSNLNPKFMPIVRNDKVYGYRNKVQVPIGLDRNNKVISGFYEAKTHNIVPIKKCLIEPSESSLILDRIKELIVKYEIPIYDEKTNSGVIKHFMCRVNNSNEFMVVIVATKKIRQVKEISDELMISFPNIVSMYLNINKKNTNVVLGEEFILINGQPYLIEDINGLKFKVHPNSFLQVNHDQCEKLYNKAIEYGNISSDDVIIDAYCGIGTISLNLAKKAKKVYGIEVVKEAIINANENMVLNNIKNVEFICGKCEDEIKKIANKESIDIIFVDPPRKGCDIEFLKTIIDMKIKKIVYISCMPSTFARDAKILTDAGYVLEEVTPFDLFSHSNHVELTCSFNLKSTY